MRVEERRLKTETELNSANPSLFTEVPFSWWGKGLMHMPAINYNAQHTKNARTGSNSDFPFCRYLLLTIRKRTALPLIMTNYG